MTWEDILKQKKEYRVYFEFYMNSGQRAPSFDVDIKFTGTLKEATEFAKNKVGELMEKHLKEHSDAMTETTAMDIARGYFKWYVTYENLWQELEETVVPDFTIAEGTWRDGFVAGSTLPLGDITDPIDLNDRNLGERRL